MKDLASKNFYLFEIFIKASIEFKYFDRKLNQTGHENELEKEKSRKKRHSSLKNMEKSSQVPDKLLLFATTEFKSACEWVSEIESLLL